MTDPQHEETFADTERKLREIITTLRAQLARREEMHDCAMKERDDTTLYADELRMSLRRAEAALAAQIEVDAGIVDDMRRNPAFAGMGCDPIIEAIRNQPHDRTALDLMLAEAREKALREAADELRGQGYGAAIRAILALIEEEKAE